MRARGSILSGETARSLRAETSQRESARSARKVTAEKAYAKRKEMRVKSFIRGMRDIAPAILFFALAPAAWPGQSSAPRPSGNFRQASFRKPVPGRIPGPQEKPEPPASAASVVNGTANLRERAALPPGAYFEATLAEVSAGGAPDVIIATARVENPGNPPIRFAIAYDGARISEGRTYVVRATISAGGHALYVSEAAYPVITHGNPKRVDIVLRRANGEAKPPVPEKTEK
jgi:putative lipoprotein